MQRITDPAQMDLQPLVCRIDKRDLEEGVKDSPTHCPAAKALNRRLRPRFQALVSVTDVWIVERKSGKTRFRHKLPALLKKFIREFDMGIMPYTTRNDFFLKAPSALLASHKNNLILSNPNKPFKHLLGVIDF
jgi:hypothetical protein